MAKYISNYKKWITEMNNRFRNDENAGILQWVHIRNIRNGRRLALIDCKTEKTIFFTVHTVPEREYNAKADKMHLNFNKVEEKIKEKFAIAYAKLRGITIPETRDMVKLNNLSNQQEFFDECGNKYIYIGKFKDKHSVYSERDEANILLDNMDVFVE